jgi:hypothetical protein
MADTRHLQLHHRKWQVHYRLPTDIAHNLGKTHIYRSLGTRDLAETVFDSWPWYTPSRETQLQCAPTSGSGREPGWRFLLIR